MKVSTYRTGYEALARFLSNRWGWQAIDELPETELVEVTIGENPAGFQLTNAGLFSEGTLTILRDSDNCYYTAWGNFIPFRDWKVDLNEGEYTKFGVFTNPTLLHSDLSIKPENS